jgi:hypothetical protein
MCSYKACKSLHERGFNVPLQGNLYGGGVVFWIVKVLTTLKNNASKRTSKHE